MKYFTGRERQSICQHHQSKLVCRSLDKECRSFWTTQLDLIDKSRLILTEKIFDPIFDGTPSAVAAHLFVFKHVGSWPGYELVATSRSPTRYVYLIESRS